MPRSPRSGPSSSAASAFTAAPDFAPSALTALCLGSIISFWPPAPEIPFPYWNNTVPSIKGIFPHSSTKNLYRFHGTDQYQIQKRSFYEYFSD